MESKVDAEQAAVLKTIGKILKYQRLEFLHKMRTRGWRCALIQKTDDQFCLVPIEGPEALDPLREYSTAIFILRRVPIATAWVGDRRKISAAIQEEFQRMFGEYPWLTSKSNVDPVTKKSRGDLQRPYHFSVHDKKVSVNVHWNEQMKGWYGYFNKPNK